MENEAISQGNCLLELKDAKASSILVYLEYLRKPPFSWNRIKASSEN